MGFGNFNRSPVIDGFVFLLIFLMSVYLMIFSSQTTIFFLVFFVFVLPLFGNALAFTLFPVLVIIFTQFKNFSYHISFMLDESGFDFENLSAFFGFDYFLISVYGLLAYFCSRVYRNKVFLLYPLVILLYIVIGLLNVDVLSVASYTRFYLVPLFAIALGVMFARYGSERYITSCLVLVSVYIAIELIPFYYEFIQVDRYLELKYYGRETASTDYLHKMGMTLNGVRIERLLGPQLHPISVGYTLLFIYSYLYANTKQIFYISTPIFWILLFLTSKGALTAGLLLFSIFFVYDFLHKNMFSIKLLFILYTISLLVISSIPSLTSGYEHMLGLIGGIHNLSSNPIGSGVGAGGTMSALKGYEYGGESGFGTVITHLGLLGVLIYLLTFKRLLNVMKLKDKQTYAFSAYCMVILINSFLQEEALLPSAAFLGWFMLSYRLYQRRSFV